jgi:hypothetical protein
VSFRHQRRAPAPSPRPPPRCCESGPRNRSHRSPGGRSYWRRTGWADSESAAAARPTGDSALPTRSDRPSAETTRSPRRHRPAPGHSGQRWPPGRDWRRRSGPLARRVSDRQNPSTSHGAADRRTAWPAPRGLLPYRQRASASPAVCSRAPANIRLVPPVSAATGMTV